MSKVKRIRFKVDGLVQLGEALEQERRKARRCKAKVVIGFKAVYALYQHEELQLKHPVGQALYLSTAALADSNLYLYRFNQKFREGWVNGNIQMLEYLMEAARTIRREAQRLVPVDTGYLRSTAYERPD